MNSYEKALTGTTRHIQMIIDDAAQVTSELDFSNPSKVLYQAQWLEGCVMDNAMAHICEGILARVDNGHTLQESLLDVHGELKHQLLKNYMRASSTDGFRNAVEDTKREAASRMFEKVESWLDHLDRANVVTEDE